MAGGNREGFRNMAELCIALDGLSTLEDVRGRVEDLKIYADLFKIGKELFTRFGPDAIRSVHDAGSRVFFDAKYFDTPHTVKEAATAAAGLEVAMFNIHALGGLEMMKAAVKAAKAVNNGVKVIAVTILTSTDQEMMNSQMHIPGTIDNQVLHLAELAREAGCDGIVCSAQDITALKDHLPPKFIYVTPGIKSQDTPADDQKRICTPKAAVDAGSTVLVVGGRLWEKQRQRNVCRQRKAC